MKAWLGLATTLCFVYTGYAESTPCGSDETEEPLGTCICNSILYNSSDPATIHSLQCLAGQMKLTLSRCQLEKSKYDSAKVHLIDSTCGGVRVIDGTAQVVVTNTANSTSCGNKLYVNGTHAIYSNNLTIPAKIFANGLIAKQNVSFAFSCSYSLNMTAVLAAAINPMIGTTDITLPGGVGSVTVTMAVYKTSDFLEVYSESSLPFNIEDQIYVGVEIPALNGDLFSVKVIRLYAQGSNGSSIVPQYDLISNGCPSEELGSLVAVKKNGQGNEARFVISIFEITSSDSVYLYADVQICENTCEEICGTRSGRQGISGNIRTLNMGPIRADDFGLSSGASDRFSWTWTVNYLLLSLLGVRLL